MATLPLNEFTEQAQPINGQCLVPAAATPNELIRIALTNNAAIGVIERLFALQQDERNYQTRVAFDEALSRCQAQLTRISADANNPSTNSRYATYAKLDKIVRPIYTAEGFSLSFGERDCPTPGKTRFVAFLSRAGVTREYLKDMSPSTKGAKGGDVMTPIHADASADSYAKRYLLKDIFNIAIGEADNDGNGGTALGVPPEHFRGYCRMIQNAEDLTKLRAIFGKAYREADTAKDRNAMAGYIQAKDARKKELQ
jgi:hypothetical protein